MNKFKLGERSLGRLKGVNPKLTELLLYAIARTPVDFGVAWMGGFRTAEQQNQLFKQGVSQRDGYKLISNHQTGNAVDLNIFVGNNLVQNDKMSCIVAGVILTCAEELNMHIRWGLDWNENGDIRDNKFNDIYHFEIVT